MMRRLHLNSKKNDQDYEEDDRDPGRIYNDDFIEEDEIPDYRLRTNNLSRDDEKSRYTIFSRFFFS